MRLARWIGAAALVLSASAAAQQSSVELLTARLGATTPTSAEWFATTAELIEAQLRVDGRAALATAVDAWEAAQRSEVAGAAETMAAMAELVVSRVEGPNAAAAWRERDAGLPDGAAPHLAVHYHVARARSLCAEGDHAAEMPHSIAGQESAELSGDDVLKLRAAQVTLHLTPERGLDSLRQRYELALEGPSAAQVRAFEPWVLLDEVLATSETQPRDAVLAALERVESLAREFGDSLALAHAYSLRGNLHAHSAPAEALKYYEQASEILGPLGDRREFAGSLDMQAWVSGRLGEFERANECVGRAMELIDGRGFDDVEAALLTTRIDLAVRTGNGAEAARLSAERDQLAGEAAAERERVRVVRAQLAQAEADAARREAELQLAAERAREKFERHRVIAVCVAIALLFGLVAVFWVSRRRLSEANRKLAAEVERVEAARRVQSALEERLRSLERSQGLGTMAAGVAHDFNNLLTGILANAELIETGGARVNPSALAKSIQKAGRRAADLCRELQTYSGGAPPSKSRIDVGAALRALLPVLRSACGEGVDVELLAEAEGPFIEADASELEQAVLHLVINARDAKARTVRVSASAPLPGRVRIEVRDDGEGMAREIAERIFDPFFTTRFPGRGLGLAVVNGIVRRHGGAIEVQSETGAGATFRIDLPAADQAPAPSERARELPAPLPARHAATVLVVDDDDNVRNAVLHMLRFQGSPAEGFTDGQSFLAAVERAPADKSLLVFVDLTMPGEDGVEVMQRVRVRRPDAHIVLMSGHADAFVGQVASAAKPDRVLTKPISLARLREALDEMPPAQ